MAAKQLVPIALALALAPLRLPAQSRAVVVLRSDSLVRVARARTRSVVSLHTIGRPAAGDQSEGLGSAVVIGRDGLLLTNAHVVEGAAVVHVRTTDGLDIEAAVIGRDAASDLALLRASDATDLIPVTLGDSDRIEPGAFVVAIGSPFGLHHTVTAGILSAKARGRDDSGLEFLQTDAAVNPGNSGGGLFDLDGRLIGITNGILAPPGGGNVGLNFAIPVNVIRALLPQLRTGAVQHGWLGVSTRGVNAPEGRWQTGAGAAALEILKVADGGPAAQAGLATGDLLVGAALNGRLIPANRIHGNVWLARPGTEIDLSVWRDPRVRTVRVMIGALPQTR